MVFNIILCMRKFQEITLISVIVIFVKLLFSFLPSFAIDMSTWLAWGYRLAELGPAHFYSTDIWTHYTPGFLYWLFLGGKVGLLNEFFIKASSIVADVFLGLIIYSLVKKAWSEKAALVSFLFYTLNPGIIFNSSVWGQIDGVFTLFLFLAIYFLLEKPKLFISAFFWSVAFLIKPQALALLPAIAWVIFDKFRFRGTIKYFVVSAILLVIGSLPFYPNDILGLPKLIITMANDYPYTSLFAYNFWGIVGIWQNDSQEIAGLTFWAWGTVFYILALVGCFVSALKTNNKWRIYLFCALTLFAFFLFPTRVHERYLFPVFTFLLTAGFLSKNKNLIFFYIVLSILHFLNIFYPYAYYQLGNITSNNLAIFIGDWQKYISAGMITLFFSILLNGKLPDFIMPSRKSRLLVVDELKPLKMVRQGEHFREPRVYPWVSIKIFNFKLRSNFFRQKDKTIYIKGAKKYLILILAFTAITRFIWLWSPENFYFDEVYHAFTAREIVRGNPQAWEFSATPPEGYAFEWTHPPLAKLFMSLGIFTFGEHPFSWRVPGVVFGIFCVYFLYLIAKEIFKNERIALLSAFIFSLDGMPLVMSRIGMNDIYFLFFAIGTLLFFLKDKILLSALFLGLAFASKWTAFFIIPVLILAWFTHKRKFLASYFWFLLLPGVVYFFSYFVFFTSGHNLLDFWHTQQQMWWYHTGLVATHPYSSPWWSWPLMLKPVWLYVKEDSFWQENIYIAGNPIVFFAGFVSVLLALVVNIKRRDPGVFLVVGSYACLFLPWARSPRIMFLYHYLPAIPFMILAISWWLNLIWIKKQKTLVRIFLLVVIFAFLVYFPFWVGIPTPLWWLQFRF